MLHLPQWRVEYVRRRPALGKPLTLADRDTVIVGALDRDGASAAFRQRYPAGYNIEAITLYSAMGPE